jgi:hypothetical protein
MVTLLSALGDSIYVDGEDGESKVTLIADGTAKAGWLVGQTAGDGTARAMNPTSNYDELDGIMEQRYDTDLDTAPTVGKPVVVARPKAGKKYRVKIKDPGTTLYPGEPMIPIAGTDGALDKAGDIEAFHMARISKQVANGQTFAEVTWGV